MAVLLRGQTCLYISHLVPLEQSNFAYVLGSSDVASGEANTFERKFVKMLTHLHMLVHIWWYSTLLRK